MIDVLGELISQHYFSKSLLWIVNRLIEIIATISGLIYLIYSIKGNIKLWVFGILTSSLYVYVCFISGIYADMSINIYYVVISVYGWVHWHNSTREGNNRIAVNRLKLKQSMVLLLVTVVMFVFIAIVLEKYTNSSISYWDAFTTSASITATWMLARKIIEHWILWVVIDAVSVGLYIYKDLYPTAFLFVVYTIMAIVGFNTWRKQCQIVTE